MPILYRDAKRDVLRQYNELKAAGWTPKANADGTTYSWIRGKEIYKGKGPGMNPTGGIDAEAGFGDRFVRGRRERRLMSEYVSAHLGDQDNNGKVIANATGTDKNKESNTEGRTPITVSRASTVNTPSKITSGSIKPQDKTKLVSSTLKQEVPTTIAKPTNNGVEKLVENFTDNDDPSRKWVYMTKNDIAKYYPSSISQFFHHPLTGIDSNDVNSARRGQTSMFEGETPGTKIPSTVVDENGETRYLYRNPKFEALTGRDKEDAEDLAKSMDGGLLNKNHEVYERPDGYWGVRQKGWDIAGGVANLAEGLLTPKGTPELANLKGATSFPSIGRRLKGAPDAWEDLNTLNSGVKNTGEVSNQVKTVIPTATNTAATETAPLQELTPENVSQGFVRPNKMPKQNLPSFQPKVGPTQGTLPFDMNPAMNVAAGEGAEAGNAGAYIGKPGPEFQMKLPMRDVAGQYQAYNKGGRLIPKRMKGGC